MATAAADNQPEEVDSNQEILNVQNLDYSGLHCAVTDQSHNRGDAVFNRNPHCGYWGLTGTSRAVPSMTTTLRLS